MPPPDNPMSEGTVKVMFKQIQKDLDEIKNDHKEDQKRRGLAKERVLVPCWHRFVSASSHRWYDSR